jgi:hypothetical protein
VAVLPAGWLNGGAISLLESWEYVAIGVRVSLPGAMYERCGTRETALIGCL